MSREGWIVAIGACLLLLIVPYAMCTGLSPDVTPRNNRQRPEDPLETESAPEPIEEDEPPLEEEPEPEPEAVEARTLTGEVTDAAGDPIEGAQVAIDGNDAVQTDDGGVYQLSDVPDGKVAIAVSAFGYADKSVAVGANDAEKNVVLAPAPKVTGWVLDAEGEPTSGATVACSGKRTAKTTSDAQGRYTLGKEAAGCDAIATHDAWAASPRVELKLGPNNLIALRTLGSIKGVIVDADGAAYRGFVLSIHSFDPADGKAKMRPYRQTFAHPQGRFQITKLHAGSYVFTVSLRGRRGVQTRTIKLKPNEQLTGVKIVVD